jgi:hypothetical protein
MIHKPTKEQLKPLLDEACSNQTEEQWIEKLLEAIKTVIEKQPLRYRGYGPYWWLIKRMFIERGFLDFGEHVDLQWLEAMDYGDEKFNLAAAFAYEDVRFETVNVYDSYHTLDTDAGTVDYVSADEDMELSEKK